MYCGYVLRNINRHREIVGAWLGKGPHTMSGSDTDFARMNIQELKSALQLHMKFVKRQRGGDRLNLSHKNVESLRFDKIDLTDAELVGLHAANASFRDACLTRANLFGADLSGVDFSKCKPHACGPSRCAVCSR